MPTLLTRPKLSNYPKALRLYEQLGHLLTALEQKTLSAETDHLIGQVIEQLNAMDDADPKLARLIKEKERSLLNWVEKQHQIVPKNHYRTRWTLLGMSAFGVPVGVAIGTSIGHLGLLGVGLPIGMAVGYSIGVKMDKKAQQEDRQLDFEAKY